MSSQVTGIGSEAGSSGEFGANEWLVDEMYQQFKVDRNSVDKSWWPILENYHQTKGQVSSPAANASSESKPAASESKPAQAEAAPAPSDSSGPASDQEPQIPVEVTNEPSGQAPSKEPAATTGSQPIARTTSLQAKPQPIPAEAPAAPTAADEPSEPQDVVTPLKGVAKTIAANMDQSISVPTATSYRTVPAKLMIDNRIVINNHLKRARGGKVSFTHLLAWAMVKALRDFPSQNVYYDEVDGKPVVVAPAHINLGIAIDLPKPDGSRQLVVPGVKRTETMNFSQFLAAYEDVVKRARDNKLTMADYQGNTISLTNPGGIGTVQSAPRLMKGAGCIIGAGALEYPAEFQGTSGETLANLGIGKTMTISSTYDHRVIQGAGSGEFLKLIHERLIGKHDFYEEIFADLRIPYSPIRWAPDIHVDLASAIDKTARVQELINSFRVRGHLMADVDPLEYVQRSHPDLEIESHGLTFWDLDREFVTGNLGGRRTAKLRDILGILRDAYARKVGVEYMHIQNPEERKWMQERLEAPYEKPTHDEQMRILAKLNEAEAFETFLQTKYVGQKRFSLEGGESMIALLDAILQGAAEKGLEEVAIGMAHRGRLNVLTNIAGKTYGQIFREFEGTQDPRTVQGSGDVKYHLGTEGTFTALGGEQIPVYLAANPSHLEAVDGVLEGIVRAKQDRKPIGTFQVVPIMVHGDAAMAGQGIVVEVLQMSQLRGYRTGGTIHVVVNNQVGFTTPPGEARSSVYSTDVAKTVQAPIFHVNGDDPEAVVRVAELALEFREKFHKDVVVDLICYRRRGHNEGDDPSMTQPLMYNLIEAKRSVRTLYGEALVGRGDITQEEYAAAQADFQDRLERAFAETHAAQTNSMPIVTQDDNAQSDLERPDSQQDDRAGEPETTAVAESVITTIGDAHANKPAGFTVHPKLDALLKKRVDMSRKGGVDWGFGELIALGSLLLEGTPVRFAGQDARRGTFVQRHAVLHDRENGQEWLPLLNLSENQARFWIYDSLLSEYAAMGFEYGYSVERADALVLWEAQFGDFANGAQTVIDEFIASAEQKWGQRSSVVLLLPHGYEGQGPDHSSARIERFLQLCAENNMTVARPSTPASYFHLLRRQAYARPRRPLVVFTPKAMLRLRGATSDIADFTNGRFEPVIDDTSVDKGAVKRVVLHAGKLHYDLKNEMQKRDINDIALVRVEQYYPLPLRELSAVLSQYPNAELMWAQEEPENQGAWPFIYMELKRSLPNREMKVACRPASASPATGSTKRSAQEQADLIDRALTI
ncbi:multifunctional oxoglutarate decarboxylase/oxoglutarate dehydrogenase thiamine pyrophosphate-binding subunit/dihydrolipoyllysine-residue succinyltransferase subunit [Salinibacterium sp. dk2585]|uniref:multifunctional oxoglutarate decarboxylase/oxoglutarate dehydrogenase thiamine pyrophosphate-binding subunit/dihydrolipoyllysine-residue succinyltransferase subunit n=1 Tax=unclassified Salinibacterium TaxID=2632331 RepID=UPI0011C25810|nr:MULTISPECIES: multifunctional oxoglutarate decarboxylase/oxoglutarate dehydrogenase thiamine pyrophosphate-binding subunit/dihydrolipoyllysine-residue succinyltransferase subunit [unclassified Salinibacterium]QEE61804.1 multifunctional oxoglutarate decarboxylase/oxoglutarate dehydrogenase thiamine pyrophosphate-binding subunit/dihydrolipoyllysine-residue succinyltransferase subunit [Salinibacterium sp. dk2585]TXK54641.1 multifunctional oxoglutarate decarboxylase/oxoglutarate dehydrogenase thia